MTIEERIQCADNGRNIEVLEHLDRRSETER